MNKIVRNCKSSFHLIDVVENGISPEQKYYSFQKDNTFLTEEFILISSHSTFLGSSLKNIEFFLQEMKNLS